MSVCHSHIEVANALGVSSLWNRFGVFRFPVRLTRHVHLFWNGRVLSCRCLQDLWSCLKLERCCPWKIAEKMSSKRKVIFHLLFFTGYVCLRECRYMICFIDVWGDIVNLVKDHPTGHVDCFGKGVPWDMTSIFLYTASPKTKPSSLVVVNPWHGSSYFIWFWTSVYYACTVPIVR